MILTRTHAYLMALLLALIAVIGAGAFTKAEAATTVQDISYGPSPLQVVTLHKQSAPGRHKTIIYVHGGGWNSGGRGSDSIAADIPRWTADGWNVVNMAYRLGTLDGKPGDGAALLADVTTVVQHWRGATYVDPSRVVLVGESAGGQLATTVAAKLGKTKVAGVVAWSPVASPQNAATDGAAGVSAKMTSLGVRAQEFFGYSWGTTSPFRYVKDGQAPPMWIVGSVDDWVTWDRQGGALCRTARFVGACKAVPGTRHADEIRDANPALANAAIAWADNRHT